MHPDDIDSIDPLCALWQAAVDSEVGIGIQTDDRGLLRQHLYRARSLADNPAFEQITMVLPEKENEIWLVKKNANSSGTTNKSNLKPVR
jgi:DNA-binding phage protein